MKSKLLLSLAVFSLSFQGLSAGEEEEIELLFEELEKDAAKDEEGTGAGAIQTSQAASSTPVIEGESALVDAKEGNPLQEEIILDETSAIQKQIVQSELQAVEKIEASLAEKAEEGKLENVTSAKDSAQPVVEKVELAQPVAEERTQAPAEEQKVISDLAPELSLEKKTQDDLPPAAVEKKKTVVDRDALKKRLLDRRAAREGAAQKALEERSKVGAASPSSETAPAAPSTPAKRIKPHFAGAKTRPPSAPRSKKSSKIPMKIRRESRTIPASVAAKKRGQDSQALTTSHGDIKAATNGASAEKKDPSAENSFLTPAVKKQLTADNSPGVISSVDKNDEDRSLQGNLKGKNSSAYLTGEWLFWRTRQGGMEYAVARSSDAPGVFTDAVSKKVAFNWNSGFRVGLGVHLPYDGWDIYVNYTRFRPDHSSHAHGSLFPLLLYQGQFAAPNVTDAKAHWKISFQNLDVELGRAYFLSKALLCHPYIGVKGAWIDQSAHVYYAGGNIPKPAIWHVNFDNDFKGGGILAGVDSNWELGEGFSLFGNGSVALLVGFYELSHNQKQNEVETIDLDANLHQISPMLQLILGAGWDKNFGRCHLGFSAGFESQCWWQQNQMEHFTDTTQPIFVRQNDALNFYGVTIQGRFDF